MAINKSSQDEHVKSQKKSVTFFRMLSYLKGYKKTVTIVITIMIIASIIMVALPLLIQNIIDVQIMGKNISGVITVVIVYLVLSLIWWLCYSARVRMMAKVCNEIIVNIRDSVFAHLQTLGLYYFDSRPTGKILSRLIGDITSLKTFLNQAVTIIVPNIFFILCVVVVMFVVNPMLALSVIASLPVILGGTFLIMKYSYPMWQDYRKKQSNVSGYSHEIFSGIKAVQSFTAETETEESFDVISNEVTTYWVKAVRIMDLLGILIDVSQGLGYFFLYLIAVNVLKIDATSVGELVAFSFYIGLFWQPIRAISNMWNQLGNHIAGAERVFEILDTEPTLFNAEDVIDFENIKGDVEFSNVTFAYPDELDKNVIENVNFKVKSGETIALVGPTGAGKTTIINLVCRFYDPTGGEVRIDGKDIAKVEIAALHKNVGVMTQESYLFSGTVWENLRYGKLNASDIEILKACKAIGSDEFISKLEKGYDTEITQSSLSHGQRQLLALTRTLLSDPKILILDEATSAIDTHTELLVQKGIKTLMEGRTSFVVAHRLSTIKHADKIMVIDKKGILEQGNHNELLEKGGHYKDLYEAQFGN